MGWRVAWYTVLLMVFSTLISIVSGTPVGQSSVPLGSMTPETHPADDQRGRIIKSKTVFGVGTMLVSALAFSFVLEYFSEPILSNSSSYSSGSTVPGDTSFAYFFGAALLAPFVGLCGEKTLTPALPLVFVARNPAPVHRQVEFRKYISDFRSLLRNRSYLTLMFVNFFGLTGYQACDIQLHCAAGNLPSCSQIFLQPRGLVPVFTCDCIAVSDCFCFYLWVCASSNLQEEPLYFWAFTSYPAL
jgi:MFS family permease